MRYGALILILLAGGLSAQDSKKGKSFLCIADGAVGFIFNDKSKTWDATVFGGDDSKYIVRPIPAEDEGLVGMTGGLAEAYGVWKFGEDYPILLCEEGISEHNWLTCGGGGLQHTVQAEHLV